MTTFPDPTRHSEQVKSWQIGEISTEDTLSFLNRVTEGKKPQTRRIR